MDTAPAPPGPAAHRAGYVLDQLREAAALLQNGKNSAAAGVVRDLLDGGTKLPDGVLPWLTIAHGSLTGADTTVPGFLALQTAIVLLEV